MNVQIHIDGRQVLGVLYRTDSDLLIYLPGVLVGVKSPPPGDIYPFGELFAAINGKAARSYVHIYGQDGEELAGVVRLKRGPDGDVYAKICSLAELPQADIPPGFVLCPKCKGSGTESIPVPEFIQEEGWGKQAKVRCDLCWGTGVLPKPQAFGGEGDPQFALGYWDCVCQQDYIHPDNHDVCLFCGATQDAQPASRADEVRRHLAALGVEVEKGEVKRIERSPTPAEADGLVCSGCDQVFECVEQQPGGDECQGRRLS